jgi:hypothetical protein
MLLLFFFSMFYMGLYDFIGCYMVFIYVYRLLCVLIEVVWFYMFLLIVI